jgi:hypothetical protein
MSEGQAGEAGQAAQAAEGAEGAEGTEAAQAGRAAQRKNMRAVHSAILVFEAIVVGLAIPVAITLNGVSGAVAGTTGGVVAVSCLVAAGLLRKPIGYLLGSVLQVVTFALGFVVPLMFVLGIAFGALWFYCLILDRRLRRRFRAVSPTAE